MTNTILGKERWFNKVFWGKRASVCQVFWEDECDYFVKISVDLTKCSEILGVDKQTILRKQVGNLAKKICQKQDGTEKNSWILGVG